MDFLEYCDTKNVKKNQIFYSIYAFHTWLSDFSGGRDFWLLGGVGLLESLDANPQTRYIWYSTSSISCYYKPCFVVFCSVPPTSSSNMSFIILDHFFQILCYYLPTYNSKRNHYVFKKLMLSVTNYLIIHSGKNVGVLPYFYLKINHTIECFREKSFINKIFITLMIVE